MLSKRLFFNRDTNDIDVSLLEDSLLNGKSMLFQKMKVDVIEKNNSVEFVQSKYSVRLQSFGAKDSILYTIAFLKCYRYSEIDKSYYKSAKKRGSIEEKKIVAFMEEIGFNKPLFSENTKIPYELSGLELQYAIDENIEAENILLGVFYSLHKKLSGEEGLKFANEHDIGIQTLLDVTNPRYGLSNLINSTSKNARSSTKRALDNNIKTGSCEFLSLLELILLTDSYNSKYNFANMAHTKTLSKFLSKKIELESASSIESFFGTRYSLVLNLFSKDNRKYWSNPFPLFGKYFTYSNASSITDKKFEIHTNESKYKGYWERACGMVDGYKSKKDGSAKYRVGELLEAFVNIALPKSADTPKKKRKVFSIMKDVFKFVEPYITDSKFLKSEKISYIYQTHSPVRPNTNFGIGAEMCNGLIFLDLDLKYTKGLGDVIDRVGDSELVKKTFASRVLEYIHDRLSSSYCEPYLLSKLSVSETGAHVFFKYLQPLAMNKEDGGGILPRYTNKDVDSIQILQELGYAHAFSLVMEILKEVELKDFFGETFKIPEESLGGLVKKGGGDTILDGSMRKIEQGLALLYSDSIRVNKHHKQFFVLSAIPTCYVTKNVVKNRGALNTRKSNNEARLRENFDNYKYILTGSEQLIYTVETSDGNDLKMTSDQIRSQRKLGKRINASIKKNRGEFNQKVYDKVDFNLFKVNIKKLKPIDYDKWDVWGKDDFRYHIKRMKVSTFLKGLIHSEFGISCQPIPTQEDIEILSRMGDDPFKLFSEIRLAFLEIIYILCSVKPKKTNALSHEWEEHLFYGTECPWNNTYLTNSSLSKSGIEMFSASGLYMKKKESSITKRGLPNIKKSYYKEMLESDERVEKVGNLVKDLLSIESDKVVSDSDFKYSDYKTSIKFLSDKNPLNMDVEIKAEDVEGGYFMSNYSKLFDEFFDERCFNYINSRAGSGKTTYFTELATKQKKRVLLVMPYTAPMDSKFGDEAQIREIAKINNNQEISPKKREEQIAATKAFRAFSGSKQNKEMMEALKLGISSVITFDKFSRMDSELLLNYDYVAIDEIHILATESIRSTDSDSVCTMALKKIREMLEYKKDNPYEHIPYMIGMTGTHTYTVNLFRMCELDVRGGKDKMGVRNIKLTIPHKSRKNLKIELTTTSKECKVLLCKRIAESVIEKKTVICPTDEGSFRAEEIIKGVNAHLIMKNEDLIEVDEWHYYKRATKESRTSKIINGQSIIPKKIKVLFCSVYLSVGVDIKNISEEKDIVVLSTFAKYTAQTLEQFGNRLRKQNIDTHLIRPLYNSNEKQGKLYYELKPEYNNSLDYRFLKGTHKAVDGEMKSRIDDDKCVAYFNHYISLNDDKISESQKVSLWADLSKRFTFSYEDYIGEIKTIQDNLMILRYVAEAQYNKLGTNIRYIVNMFRKHYNYNEVVVDFVKVDEWYISDAIEESRNENSDERKKFSVDVTKNIFAFINNNKPKDIEKFISSHQIETIHSDEHKITLETEKPVRLLIEYPEKHHKRLRSITGKLMPIAKQYAYSPQNFNVLVDMCLNEKSDGLVIAELERFSNLIEFKNYDIQDTYIMIVQKLERMVRAKRGNRMSKHIEIIEKSESRIKRELQKAVSQKIGVNGIGSTGSSIAVAEKVRAEMKAAYNALVKINYTLTEDMYTNFKNTTYSIAISEMMNNKVRGLSVTSNYNDSRLKKRVEENLKTFFMVKTNPHTKDREISLRILPSDFKKVMEGVVKTHGNKDMKFNEFELHIM